MWSYLKRSYILTILRSYTPHYKQESAENVLAMVTLRNVMYRLSSLSHLVRHSKYGSCLLWVMSTEISVDIAVDLAVDSRSTAGR